MYVHFDSIKSYGNRKKMRTGNRAGHNRKHVNALKT